MKTDGLAAGKGVLVTESLTEAIEDVRAKLSGASFGAAGTRVVIEEGLTGPELSLLCVCDGERIVPLAPAQDYKRVGDGDAGPNTGGMGAFSPVPAVGDDLVGQILETIVEPTLGWLLRNDIDYRGVLYAGLMLTPDGPKGDRVQRPLRRSGGTGRAAPRCERPRRPARRGSRGTNPLAGRLQFAKPR